MIGVDEMKLLRGQKMGIAQLMVNKGLSPADFRWEDLGTDEKLYYRDSRYYFFFGDDHITFCPAKRDLEINIRLTGASGNFSLCTRWVSEWLTCLKHESNTPEWEGLVGSQHQG